MMPNGMLKDMTNGELNRTRKRLGTGDLVTVPAPYRIPGCTDRVTVVVEWVSPDDSWFTDVNGSSYRTGDAVVIPLGVPASGKAA